MSPIRTAVIGVGNMGSAHAHCIAQNNIDGLVLSALCDIAPERQAVCQAAFPHVPCFATVEDLIQSHQADAVIVAVPHPIHSEIAIAALHAGLHVMVEKPIDIAISKARALCEYADQCNSVFAVMLNQRTNPLYQRAREIVQGGFLGEIKRSVWIITNWYRTQHYYDSGTWRATWAGEGGGVLVNQAPHNLDLWQWICGMPTSVMASCDIARHHHIEVEDDVTIFTRYANGASGTFITSTGESPGTNRLEITGDRGKLVLEQGVLKWWRLKEAEREFCFRSNDSFAEIPFDYEEFHADNAESAHAAILQNWANAILYGEKLISPGCDALCSLELSNAAYLSQWSGNTAISLPIKADIFDSMLKEHVAASSIKSGSSSEERNECYSQRWQVNW